MVAGYVHGAFQPAELKLGEAFLAASVHRRRVSTSGTNGSTMHYLFHVQPPSSDGKRHPVTLTSYI